MIPMTVIEKFHCSYNIAAVLASDIYAALGYRNKLNATSQHARCENVPCIRSMILSQCHTMKGILMVQMVSLLSSPGPEAAGSK